MVKEAGLRSAGESRVGSIPTARSEIQIYALKTNLVARGHIPSHNKMYTRSQKSSPRVAPAPARVVYSKDNVRWTASEEREMVRLRRYENKSFDEIGKELHRAPEAINFRFRKLIDEHVEGGHSRKEVLRWFNLSDE